MSLRNKKKALLKKRAVNLSAPRFDQKLQPLIMHSNLPFICLTQFPYTPPYTKYPSERAVKHQKDPCFWQNIKKLTRSSLLLTMQEHLYFLCDPLLWSFWPITSERSDTFSTIKSDPHYLCDNGGMIHWTRSFLTVQCLTFKNSMYNIMDFVKKTPLASKKAILSLHLLQFFIFSLTPCG